MQEDDNVVGFFGRPEGLRITLPPCYPEQLRHAPSLDESLQLFRVLRKYRQLSGGRNAVKVQNGPRGVNGFAETDAHQLSVIEAGLGLAEDYRQHGLMRFREMRVHGGPTGRIDWARTLQRGIATPTAQSVIFAEPQRRHLAFRDDHPLTQLHATTIRDVFERFFGQRVDLEVEPPCNELYRWQYGGVLSRCRGRLYQERQLSIVQLIEAYWKQNFKGARSVDTTWEYTEKFAVLWEEMCRNVIGGASVDGKAWPSGRYVGSNGRDLGTGLRLVADFVRKVDGHVIVFDAKFYTSDSLPDSYSVLKQLAYGFYLSREWHNSGVPPHNLIHVFLFPTFRNLSGYHASLRGRHVVSPSGRSSAMAAPIFLVDLDYGAVVSAYLRYGAIDVNAILALITADRLE